MLKATNDVVRPFEAWHAPSVPPMAMPPSVAWTLWDTQEDAPLASGGFAAPWPGMAQVWVSITPKGRAHTRRIARQVRRRLRQEWASGQWRRLECLVRADDAVSRRWVGWLGFLPVTYKRGYGPHGEDYWEYVYVGRERTHG